MPAWMDDSLRGFRSPSNSHTSFRRGTRGRTKGRGVMSLRYAFANQPQELPGLDDCGDGQSEPGTHDTEQNRDVHKSRDLAVAYGILDPVSQDDKRRPLIVRSVASRVDDEVQKDERQDGLKQLSSWGKPSPLRASQT